MKKIISTLATILVVFTLSAQGLHIFKADGSYEIIKAIDVDSIVFFSSSSDKITITILNLDAPHQVIKGEAIVANDAVIPITRCGFCLATHSNPSISDEVFISHINDPNISMVAYVQPNQRYYVRAFAEREYGIAYSQVMSITTGNAEDQYVDLGLPSGLKWAKCNIGATTPEDLGDYFAWGETTTKNTYNWINYKWCEGSKNTLTKYCVNNYYGTVDNKTTLDLVDDAAYVNWGGNWRMPTKAEQDELRNNCTWNWTQKNGINGYEVIGPNGNSIFLPAAGYCDGSLLLNAGPNGYYWSSSLNESLSNDACGLGFDSGCIGWGDYGRYPGLTIRPVYK